MQPPEQRASNTEGWLDLPLPGFRQILDFSNAGQFPNLSLVLKAFCDAFGNFNRSISITSFPAAGIWLTIEAAKLPQWDNDRICRGDVMGG